MVKMNVIDYIAITCNLKNDRLHMITWTNVIDYSWLRLPHVCLKIHVLIEIGCGKKQHRYLF